MAEWSIDPVRLVNEWPEDLLVLMARRLLDRKKREAEAMKGNGDGETRWQSPDELARSLKRGG
ncbi:MAG: hypothetical protein WC551_12000 [Patescibacteria group bacterium]